MAIAKMDPREKEFEKALRKLTPVFQRKLAAKDVRHDLYGKEQLTWNEYERIGRPSGGGEGVVPTFYVCFRCGKNRWGGCR